MAADRIIYCLEKVTDYKEFEKFCCAVLAGLPEYRNIVPIGGSGDGGRDAIVRDDGEGKKIVFAFSVNKDWFDKLKHDCKRVNETQMNVHKFVFVCTRILSGNDQDKAFDYITDTYRWRPVVYDLAWLRTRLVQPDGQLLIESHPSIFTPDFFPKSALAQRKFAQEYLDEYAGLFQYLADSDEQLAVEIHRKVYAGIEEVVQNADAAQLRCYDSTTLEALRSLHDALKKIYGVISDNWYILPSEQSWRIKFDNCPRPNVDVQAVLEQKKQELLPYLDEFRGALENFAQVSKDSELVRPTW